VVDLGQGCPSYFEVLLLHFLLLIQKTDSPLSISFVPTGLWAELMRRSLGVDVLGCPWCGGRLTLIGYLNAFGMFTGRLCRRHAAGAPGSAGETTVTVRSNPDRSGLFQWPAIHL
jgi:hypothetical protein